jgi:hypothetical protein
VHQQRARALTMVAVTSALTLASGCSSAKHHASAPGEPATPPAANGSAAATDRGYLAGSGHPYLTVHILAGAFLAHHDAAACRSTLSALRQTLKPPAAATSSAAADQQVTVELAADETSALSAALASCPPAARSAAPSPAASSAAGASNATLSRLRTVHTLLDTRLHDEGVLK